MKKLLGLMMIAGSIAAQAQTNVGSSMVISCVSNVSRIDKAQILLSDEESFEMTLNQTDAMFKGHYSAQKIIQFGDVEQALITSYNKASGTLVIEAQLRQKDKNGKIKILALAMQGPDLDPKLTTNDVVVTSVKVKNPEIPTVQANNPGFTAYQLLQKGLFADKTVIDSTILCTARK